MPAATVEVVRTYLEMTAPEALAPARGPAPTEARAFRVERVGFCPAAFFRFLYGEVGRAYRWTDRLGWSDGEIRAYLDAGDVSFHVLYVEHAPGGYFELKRDGLAAIEIAYFGLLPDYVGHGLGGWLLTRAVETAWADKPARVWLHTCTLDHPAALPNYLKRGFRRVREERYLVPAILQAPDGSSSGVCQLNP
ncbi:MAG TPA: GNAT family N-acetyltransferase [Gemmatimonadales bacterium]|nr:GNAT family N-acetyltransferase [Gemmatimonadales bacterium]